MAVKALDYHVRRPRRITVIIENICTHTYSADVIHRLCIYIAIFRRKIVFCLSNLLGPSVLWASVFECCKCRMKFIFTSAFRYTLFYILRFLKKTCLNTGNLPNRQVVIEIDRKRKREFFSAHASHQLNRHNACGDQHHQQERIRTDHPRRGDVTSGS